MPDDQPVSRAFASDRATHPAASGPLLERPAPDNRPSPDATILAASRAFVAERLISMAAHPNGWGPPIAVEIQFINCIEMLHTLNGVDPSKVLDTNRRFGAFLSSRFSSSSLPLSGLLHLKDNSTPEFIGILTEFARQEQAGIDNLA